MTMQAQAIERLATVRHANGKADRLTMATGTKKATTRVTMTMALFGKAVVSIKQPVTAHGPVHPKVSSRPRLGR